MTIDDISWLKTRYALTEYGISDHTNMRIFADDIVHNEYKHTVQALFCIDTVRFRGEANKPKRARD